MSQNESSITDETFGALVRTHRDALGLTQQALARACQLSPIYISQIEKGERIPSVSACRALATALGCQSRLLVAAGLSRDSAGGAPRAATGQWRGGP